MSPAEAAISLVDTPFVQGQRVAGLGVDCWSFIVLVGELAGCPVVQPNELYRRRTKADVIRKGLALRLTNIDIQPTRSSAVLLFWLKRKEDIGHFGVTLADGLFAHAQQDGRGVIVSSLDDEFKNVSWRDRIDSMWSYR